MPGFEQHEMEELAGQVKDPSLRDKMLQRYRLIKDWELTGNIRDMQGLLALDRYKSKRLFEKRFGADKGGKGESVQPEDDDVILANDISVDNRKNTALPWIVATLAGLALTGAIVLGSIYMLTQTQKDPAQIINELGFDEEPGEEGMEL